MRFGFRPNPRLRIEALQFLHPQLKRIGIRQRNVITVKMADHDVCRLPPPFNDPRPYLCALLHLNRMGQQTVSSVSEGDPRIDEKPPVRRTDETAETSDTQGFGTNDFYLHSL